VSEEPTINSLLEKQISTLEANLNRRLDATELNVGQRFDRQDKELREIKQQTQRTNGRVTVLEKARERAQGVMFAFSWLPPVLTALVTAGLTILIMALTGGLK
jgi:hypothetical protein